MRGFLKGTGARAWLSGGTVRDMLLGLDPSDFDLVTDAGPEPLARGFADATGGSFVLLSERFGACRVVSAARDATWDFTALRAKDIESDLRQRDFTVNAIAVDLAGGGELIDPCGGLADLEKRILAPVSAGIFSDDPLRMLRGLRLEAARGLKMSAGLIKLIRENAALGGLPAAERSYAELAILLEEPGTAAAVRRMDQLGLLTVNLPELAALKGVEQNRYHHLDVFEHTLAHAEALGGIIASPALFFPGDAEALKKRAGRRIAGDASWRFVMGFASLMHDIAKPGCAFIDDDGEVRFFEHELRGAEAAAEILARFRASGAVSRAVTFLVNKHMRFESLIQLGDPDERARRRYLRATGPLSPELIMISVADRLTVRGILVSDADVEKHLKLARELMHMSMEEERRPPLPKLVRGDDLIRELGVEAGPWIGKALEHVEEEQRLGRVTTREQALASAAELLNREPPER